MWDKKKQRDYITHLGTSEVSEVIKPVHVGPAVVKGVDEFVCDHSVHVRLLLDVILAQNDLKTTTDIVTSAANKSSSPPQHPYLRRSCIEAPADRPITVLTGQMSLPQHFAVCDRRRVNIHVMAFT